MLKRSMFKRAMATRPAIFIAGALILSACANNTYIGAASVEPAYMPSQLGYAAQPQGEMKVVVYGNPFRPGMPDPVFAETMASAMVGANFGPTINFTTKPTEPNPDNYQVVVQFTGDPPLSGRDICRSAMRDEAPQTTESSGAIPVRMACCGGPKLLTEVLAHFGGATGITVEKSEALIARMITILLPPSNPVTANPLESELKPF